jgi:imidazolonepropionase-like amidohydrolase
MRNYFLSLLCILLSSSAIAQETFPVNGVFENNVKITAIKNATIIIKPGEKIENATLLIQDRRIIAVGADIEIPKDAISIDATGKYIYPGFLDLFTDYGLPQEKPKRGAYKIQHISDKKGAYGWNEAIRSEINPIETFNPEPKSAKALREAGFTTVNSFYFDGIARGTGTVVNLSENRANEVIGKNKASSAFSFSKGTSSQNYPGSLMGSIALLRQTELDAQWYANGNAQDKNLTLEAWSRNASLPSIFEVNNVLDLLRADKIGDEMNMQFIIKGNGDEYQKLPYVKQTKASLIIPVDYPTAYDVTDPYDASMISLEDMMHWEQAPANAARLAEAGVQFAFTSDGLKNKKDFLKNIQKAIEYGLTENQALSALTITPAQMLNVQKDFGTIEKGKYANFLITDKPIFETGSAIHQTWVQGNKYEIKPLDKPNITGKFNVTGLSLGEITIESDKGGVFKPNDSTTHKVAISENAGFYTFTVNEKDAKGPHRISAYITSKSPLTFVGKGEMENGSTFKFTAIHVGELDKKEDKEKEDEKPKIGEVMYPFMAFGSTERPEAKTYLIKNATVWTNEKDGIIKNTDVLLKDGKISKIGKNLTANGAIEIDGTGKHLTAGIIDEHSHIALSGVNEGGQASSAEVRMMDVINSDNSHIYRQLAGGVTAAHLLHGSANPIGGQSALIKLRWGMSPEEMKIKGADGFIKFALGENVKQSNWNPTGDPRYPQTRMGVEQIFMDYFTRAKEYEAQWASFNKMSAKDKARKASPRKDIELETILEIINKKRFISCHSYVQSEINMLMKVTEKFGTNVNTFTHILEGYKVADKMKEHGAAGSTFSDWWAYKYEVLDAIPYNGALMHNQGVLTAFNSDDAEMGRRLNQEAAKAVKYGGLSEEEAFKFVTLNPAKMLHLDDKMGSIKSGKDGDVVVWSDNPLSIYAKAENTFIDGVLYYDAKADEKKREEVAAERNRLIQKMLAEKNGGAATRKFGSGKTPEMHCDTHDADVFNH